MWWPSEQPCKKMFRPTIWPVSWNISSDSCPNLCSPRPWSIPLLKWRGNTFLVPFLSLISHDFSNNNVFIASSLVLVTGWWRAADIGVLEDQLKVLSLLVLQLPETNYHTLRLLLRFLKDVVDHQSTNKMTATNVATVMGPNLFPLPPLDAKANRKNSAKTLSQGVNPPSIPDQFHSTPISTSPSSSFDTTRPHLNSTRIFVFFFFFFKGGLHSQSQPRARAPPHPPGPRLRHTQCNAAPSAHDGVFLTELPNLLSFPLK